MAVRISMSIPDELVDFLVANDIDDVKEFLEGLLDNIDPAALLEIAEELEDAAFADFDEDDGEDDDF